MLRAETRTRKDGFSTESRPRYGSARTHWPFTAANGRYGGNAGLLHLGHLVKIEKITETFGVDNLLHIHSFVRGE